MRTFKLNVNDQEYTIEIEHPNEFPVTVHVNGKPFVVTMTEQGPAAVQAQPAPSKLDLDPSYVPPVTSTFIDAGVSVDVETQDKAQAPAVQGDTQTVVAPMPGKVMDIMVQVGDQVKHGDTLCNLEAMKMKSPIRSTVDGSIAQVLVSEGQNVNHGDTLFALG